MMLNKAYVGMCFSNYGWMVNSYFVIGNIQGSALASFFLTRDINMLSIHVKVVIAMFDCKLELKISCGVSLLIDPQHAKMDLNKK